MAKGLRSSVKKSNKQKLRAKVFGPAEQARKERLSAKLFDLASSQRVAQSSNDQGEKPGILHMTSPGHIEY